jgi:hypothetical protein
MAKASDLYLQTSIRLLEENDTADSDTLTGACSRLNGYLESIASKQSGNDVAIDATRVLSKLVKMMKSRPQDAALQDQAVLACSMLLETGGASSRDLFVKEGGIEALLNVMNTNKDRLRAQTTSCYMLGILGEEILSLPLKTIHQVVKTVMVVMEACMKEHEVLLYGMRAIFIVCRELDNDTVRISIPVLVKAMRTHGQQSYVQATGCTGMYVCICTSSCSNTC